MRYVGAKVSPGDGVAPEVTTPGVTLYDAMVAHTWEDFRVALTGRNLADETYPVNCSICSCCYGDPRTVALTLTAAF